MLLSLAGIPLTVGFFAKFYAIAGGIGATMWPAVFALVVGSIIGLFYYLRIVVTLFSPVPESQLSTQSLGWGGRLVLGGLAVLLISLGVYPAPLLVLIRATIGG